ncbi:hypothetical protein [Streptomyces sp. NPDC050485]|uniref:hypothetical protein n=1 Tax=Streptomyces sp. NPDC050485 TaxID=3365617 RepID=UPI0037BB2594
MDSAIAIAFLNVFALTAFAVGRLAVRAVHRAPRWVYFLIPPVITAASGYAVVWLLLWPSYYAGLLILPWWGAAFLGNITGWTCPGPRRGVRACLKSACWRSTGSGSPGARSR